ncbi:P-loop containing nucleoside triphosphate hydrolase protein, partial [Lyophyllum atratum]
RCPPPTHLFTGRRNILNDMMAYFLSAVGNRHVCVLYGLGGVGKTQTGYRFVEICAETQWFMIDLSFSQVFFIDASTIDTINTDLENISLAKKIGKSAGDALRWLVNECEEWLILFNNADDITVDLSQFFPPCSHGNILITTRNPELCIHAPNAGFRVTHLDEEEARDLLLGMVSRNDNVTYDTRDQATTIELGCLPLAVVQAGAYITKTGNLSSYLELYKRNRVELWKKEPGQKHDDYRWTVHTTWQMSVDLLQPVAATFLRICSFLHHDGLSEEMFEASSAAVRSSSEWEELVPLADFLSNFLAPDGNWDPYLFQEMVADVRSYSLIDFDDVNMVFSIHPLVHTWMRTMAENDLPIQACAHYLVAQSIPPLYDLEGVRLRRMLQPQVDAVLR